MTLLTLLAACNFAPNQTADPGDGGPAVEVNRLPTEQELLGQGTPDAGPIDRAMARLAQAHNVALARCPVQGVGRVQRVHGTMRDQVLLYGPNVMVEVDDEIPWHPIYDEIVVDGKWTSLLIQPGVTQAYVRAHDRTLAMNFPAAKVGETVVCTAVDDVPTQVVAGSVDPQPNDMYAIGCTEEGVRVAGDGTFVVEAQSPCPLWVQTAGFRTAPVRVLPTGAKLQLEPLVFAPDTLQHPNLSWTDAGKQALTNVVDASDKDLVWQTKTLDEMVAELEGDDGAVRRAERWQSRFREWNKQVGIIRDGLAGKIPM